MPRIVFHARLLALTAGAALLTLISAPWAFVTATHVAGSSSTTAAAAPIGLEGESFHESVVLDPLPDHNTLTLFQFTMTHPVSDRSSAGTSASSSSSSSSSYSAFPRALGELLDAAGPAYVRLTLTQGRWHSDRWGPRYVSSYNPAPPVTGNSSNATEQRDSVLPAPLDGLDTRPAPPGAVLDVAFPPLFTPSNSSSAGAQQSARNGGDLRPQMTAREGQAYAALTGGLAGLFCTSLTVLSTGKDVAAVLTPSAAAHGHSAAHSHSAHGHSPAWVFRASLPTEAVCTENLSAATRLLPCRAHSGLAALVKAANVLAANSYLSIALTASRQQGFSHRQDSQRQQAALSLWRVSVTVAAVVPTVTLVSPTLGYTPAGGLAKAAAATAGSDGSVISLLEAWSRTTRASGSKGANSASFAVERCPVAAASAVWFHLNPWLVAHAAARRDGYVALPAAPTAAYITAGAGADVSADVSKASLTWGVPLHTLPFSALQSGAGVISAQQSITLSMARGSGGGLVIGPPQTAPAAASGINAVAVCSLWAQYDLLTHANNDNSSAAAAGVGVPVFAVNHRAVRVAPPMATAAVVARAAALPGTAGSSASTSAGANTGAVADAGLTVGGDNINIAVEASKRLNFDSQLQHQGPPVVASAAVTGTSLRHSSLKIRFETDARASQYLGAAGSATAEVDGGFVVQATVVLPWWVGAVFTHEISTSVSVATASTAKPASVASDAAGAAAAVKTAPAVSEQQHRGGVALYYHNPFLRALTVRDRAHSAAWRAAATFLSEESGTPPNTALVRQLGRSRPAAAEAVPVNWAELLVSKKNEQRRSDEADQLRTARRVALHEQQQQ